IRRIVADTEAAAPAAAGARASFCIVPAHDEADRLAGLMLARLAGLPETAVVSPPAEVSEIGGRVAQGHCTAIVISALPPRAAADAGYLARRLRKSFPELKIIVGLWTPEGEPGNQRERLLRLGVDALVARLGDALGELQLSKAEEPA